MRRFVIPKHMSLNVDCTSDCYEDKGTNPWADVAAVALSGAAMVGGIALQGHFQSKIKNIGLKLSRAAKRHAQQGLCLFFLIMKKRRKPIDPNNGTSSVFVQRFLLGTVRRVWWNVWKWFRWTPRNESLRVPLVIRMRL